MKPAILHTALIQHPCEADPAANRATTAAAIREAASRGAQLVLLQELHATPYFCQMEDTASFDLAEPVPGPTTDWLAELSAELKLVIVGSLFERRDAGLYHNTAVVLDHGRLAGRYRKMHIPDDPGYHEKFYFSPGDLGFAPVDTSVGRLGVLVCWDQWFPEAARLMSLAGAQLLLYPTAIGWDPADDADEKARQLEAWVTVQRGHAVANALPLLACNRCGFEARPGDDAAGIAFWGNSFACGPQGEVLARADDAPRTMVLSCDIDMARSEAVRRIWPFLRDRRIDAYEDLLLRYRDGTADEK